MLDRIGIVLGDDAVPGGHDGARRVQPCADRLPDLQQMQPLHRSRN